MNHQVLSGYQKWGETQPRFQLGSQQENQWVSHLKIQMP